MGVFTCSSCGLNTAVGEKKGLGSTVHLDVILAVEDAARLVGESSCLEQL